MGFISQTSSFDPTGFPNTRIVDVPCDSTVYIGAAVIMSLGGIAFNALADDLVNSNVIGIVEEKTTPTLCIIRFLGLTIDNIYSGLDVTKEYYLSDITAGLITTTPPTTSGHVIVKLGQPYSSTQFLVLKGISMVRS